MTHNLFKVPDEPQLKPRQSYQVANEMPTRVDATVAFLQGFEVEL